MLSEAPPGRVARTLESNPFPLVLVCAVGVVLLVVLAPALIVGDTWLTLMAGREVVRHGLPSTDSITIMGAGRTWTNQQWLAQLVFYGSHAVGGIRAVVLLDVLLVLVTLTLCMTMARANGATGRSTFLIGLLAVLAGPWGWTIRAQTAALPLFAATLWLLADGARSGLRRRTLLVLPLLALWANLHGSVVLGAGLTALLGLGEIVRRRRIDRIAVVLVVVAPLCVLASPYAAKLPAYYKLMLVDAPFSETLREWHWSNPSATTFLFYVLAAVAVVLLAARRSRRMLTWFEVVTLVVVLAGAVDAVRGIIWFALASMAILPVALDGVVRRPDVVAPRLNRTLSIAALAGLGVAAVVALALPTSWYLHNWPEREVVAVRAAAADPSVRVFATDRHADWLLWRIPSLRGRIAFDVRFELYPTRTIEDIVRYNGELGPRWKAITDGYGLVLVDGKSGTHHLQSLLAEPGARLVFRDARLALVARPRTP